MDTLLQLLTNWTQDSGTLRWLFIGIIATFTFLVAFSLVLLAVDLVDPFRRRLSQILGNEQTTVWSKQGFASFMGLLASVTLPKQSWDRNQASLKLINAGFRSPNALMIFYALRTLGACLFMLAVILSVPLWTRFSTHKLLLLMVFAGLLGLMLPKFVLVRLVKKRQRLIMNGFPDALDLLVVCSEAGLGLNAALERVADELTVSHPELADELAIVNAEIRAGIDRTTALKNLAKRTDLEGISGLVSVLSQTMRFGTSVADTLRIYAEEYRDKRLQKAEEQAAKLAVKMIIPIVVCIMPAFLMVILAPALLGLVQAFSATAR